LEIVPFKAIFPLYTNIDLNLWNELHGTMPYECIQWTRVIYSVVITWQSNPPISQFNRPCREFTCVWSMFSRNTRTIEALV